MAIVVTAKDSGTIIIEVSGKADILSVRESFITAGLMTTPKTAAEKMRDKYVKVADMFEKLLWTKTK